MGQKQHMKEMFKNVLEQSNKIDHYIKVQVMRTYGYTLYKHEDTRNEGKDFIEQASKLDEKYPYWSERALNLFIPQSLEMTQPMPPPTNNK